MRIGVVFPRRSSAVLRTDLAAGPAWSDAG
jgi:hypothetical protein